MIDARNGFRKDGPKSRLRDQDIYKIVDAYINKTDTTGYSRIVPFEEISDPKNDFNLNLTRYIDSSKSVDIQNIDGHLRGGIPDIDIEALNSYWKVFPNIKNAIPPKVISIITFAIILIVFFDLIKPASNNANPASIKKISAAHNATQTVLMAKV